jgi:hypothetical protein
MPKRDRFVFDITADERIRLEQHRARLGLRSHAEVIRQWIAGPLRADPVVEEMLEQASRVRPVREFSEAERTVFPHSTTDEALTDNLAKPKLRRSNRLGPGKLLLTNQKGPPGNGVFVQVGPAESKPGDLLKKPKGSQPGKKR